MRLFFPSNVFFSFPPITYLFLNCPMCSVNAHIVHGGEQYTTHRPLSHEKVRERTA